MAALLSNQALRKRVEQYEIELKKVFEEFREEQREGEKILDDFKTECNRLKDDVANSRIEVQAEISRGSEQISEEHNMALKMCENEINQIERVLFRMEELHRERMEEVVQGYSVNRKKSSRNQRLPCYVRIQNKALHWLTLGISTVIAPTPVINGLLSSFGCAACRKKRRGTGSNRGSPNGPRG